MQALRLAALGVALVISSAGVARAQAAPAAAAPPREGTGATRDRGGQQLAGLELTADQKTRLEAISVKYARENKAARDAMASDPADAMRKLMALREKMVPEFRAVLTAPQQAIFDRNVAEMKVRMDAGLRPPSP